MVLRVVPRWLEARRAWMALERCLAITPRRSVRCVLMTSCRRGKIATSRQARGVRKTDFDHRNGYVGRNDRFG
jgi:hypothetical protein